MTEKKLTGISFGTEHSPQKCSAAMKRIAFGLFASGKVTFSQFLFPYVDSFMLSGSPSEPPTHFGSHMLLWGVSAELVRQVISEESVNEKLLEPCVVELESTAGDIRVFFELEKKRSRPKYKLVGGFETLVAGRTEPWAIREQARKFCSFVEHIDRMKGCSVTGTRGGYTAVMLDDSGLLSELSEIYCAKTGGIMSEWR